MRIVIAEDNALLAQGLTALLEALGTRCRHDRDAESFVTAAVTHRPDVAVVDIRMPPTFTDEGMPGRARARQGSRPAGPRALPVRRDSYARTARRRAGVGYLLKDRVADVDDFLEALHRVAAGGTALDPEWSGSCSRRAATRCRGSPSANVKCSR